MDSVGEGRSALARSESSVTIGDRLPLNTAKVHNVCVVKIRRDKLKIGAILIVLLVIVIAELMVGTGKSPMQLGDLLKSLFQGPNSSDSSFVLWEFRIPRTLGCVLIGAILAMVGNAFQYLFRNPLAEPYVVGVSSGAAFGGAAFMVTPALHQSLGAWGTILGSVIGGMAIMLLLMSLMRKANLVSVQSLLLAGVTVGSLLGGCLSVMLVLAGQDSNRILNWMLGNTNALLPIHLLPLILAAVLGFGFLIGQTKHLNAIAYGVEYAQGVGVHVQRVKWIVLAVGTTITSICIGIVGLIGFVGLISPHLARGLIGPDLRRSLPTSALIGSLMLTSADFIAQRLTGVLYLPVGSLTAIIGAPLLLWMLRKEFI